FQFYRPLFWLMTGGRCHVKAMLSRSVNLDVPSLPYNTTVLAWIKSQRSAGRTITLATASYSVLAEQVAKHLGIFDHVLATTDTCNLKAEAKRDRLVQHYGKCGFDYVGNDAPDLPVWAVANKAWLVSPSSSVEARARKITSVAGVLDRSKVIDWQAWLRALR